MSTLSTTRHKHAILLLITLMAGCSTVVERPGSDIKSAPKTTTTVPRLPDLQPTDSVSPKDASEEIPEATRSALILEARHWLGQGLRPFQVDNEQFTADCSGYVQAVYARSGLPFREHLVEQPAREGGAAASIYRLIQASGHLYDDPRRVLPGDLIFWDNTYDRNRNGRFDDPLTHVAIAERVDADGTVHYLHRGSRGVTVGFLNLNRPEQQVDHLGKPVNSGVRQRRAGDPPGTRYLASQLFVSFGRFDPALWTLGNFPEN